MAWRYLFSQELEARIPEGQHLFENLLHRGPARDPSNELEDLRYRWMLYKSKLKDSGHLLVGAAGKGWGSREAWERQSWISLVHPGASIQQADVTAQRKRGAHPGLRCST